MKDSGRLRDALRDLFKRRRDPYASLDMGNARLMGATLWIVGGTVVAVLLPLSPPTDAIEGWGWLVGVLFVAIAFAMATLRLDDTRTPTVNTLLGASYLGVAGIVILEWLAGGYTSPYHQLYVLPVVHAVAVHAGKRVIGFFLVLGVALAAPLIYHGSTSAAYLDRGTQFVMLLATGAVARLLITVLRSQRSALRTARTRAEQLARRDALTTLGNRLAFDEALEVEVSRARRSSRPLSVLIADLDNFKQINDEVGHVGGDEALQHVADALREAARGSDQCFRWGGDEFAVLLPETDEASADRVSTRLCEAVDGAYVTPQGRRLSMTCGVAQLRTEQGPDDLVAEADRLVVDVKRRHRDSPESLPAG